MSGSRFSLFKLPGFNNASNKRQSSTKHEVPSVKKVIVAGFGASYCCLNEIDRSKSTDGKPKYFFCDMMLGARCPSSSLIDRFSADAVAFVVDFCIPYVYFTKLIFQSKSKKQHLDRILSMRENAIVLALYDHRGEMESEVKKSDETESKEAKSNQEESDETKSDETKSSDPDTEIKDWIKKTSEKHRIAIFHINTETKEGIEEAYEWLNQEIILDSLNEKITLDTTPQQEAKEQKIKEKASGYRWLAKLSKAVLTFGAHST